MLDCQDETLKGRGKQLYSEMQCFEKKQNDLQKISWMKLIQDKKLRRKN